jgi:hypothetical protein
MDGLAGNLIVGQPNGCDPYSQLYDFDLPRRVMLTFDWYKVHADKHFPGLQTHNKSQDVNS